jgi:hypothetical protein
MIQANKIDAFFLLTFGALFCGEIVLFGAVGLGELGVWSALSAHCVLLAAVVGWLSRRRTEDWSLWSIGILAVFLAGPMGALGVLGLAISLKFASLSRDVLNEWYKRVSGQFSADAASLIHDAILTDRAVKPRSDGFRRFREVMADGSLSEKQALLGLIGLKYHADYLSLLGMALRSSEASVRAQAAAVFVRLKEKFKERFEQACAAAERQGSANAGPENGLPIAEEIMTCVQSGFIDGLQVRDGRKAVKSLCEAALAAGVATETAEDLLCRALALGGEHEELAGRLASRAQTLTPPLRMMLANSLMALGRYGELRSLVIEH